MKGATGRCICVCSDVFSCHAQHNLHIEARMLLWGKTTSAWRTKVNNGIEVGVGLYLELHPLS